MGSVFHCRIQLIMIVLFPTQTESPSPARMAGASTIAWLLHEKVLPVIMWDLIKMSWT
jgi:hypothetical protein